MQNFKKRIFPVTILLLLAVVLSACSTGAMPDRTWPESLVDGETIFLANHSYIYAVDISHFVENDKAREHTGFGDKDKLRFPKDPEGNTNFGSAPVKLGDNLLLTDYSGNIRLISGSITGNSTSVLSKKSDATGRFLSSATVAGDLILAANADHKLYAYDKDLKELKWVFDEAKDSIWTRPVVVGDLIFVASIDRTVYAIRQNAKGDGYEKVWSDNTGGPVFFSLTADEDGNLYVGTLNNELISYDTKTGKRNWTVTTNGTVWSPVVVKGDRIFGGDQSGMIFSLNKSDGSTVWDFNVMSPVIGSVALDDTTVYAGTFDGRAICLSKDDKSDNRETCTKKVGGKLLSTPVFAGEYVVFGVVDGDKLLAGFKVANITNQTDKPDWTFNPSK